MCDTSNTLQIHIPPDTSNVVTDEDREEREWKQRIDREWQQHGHRKSDAQPPEGTTEEQQEAMRLCGPAFSSDYAGDGPVVKGKKQRRAGQGRQKRRARQGQDSHQ